MEIPSNYILLYLLAVCIISEIICTKVSATTVYMADNVSPSVGPSGEVVSHRGYPTKRYPPNISKRLDLTKFYNPNITNILVVKFFSPFDISRFANQRKADLTCRKSDYLYLPGRYYCSTGGRYPPINKQFSRVITRKRNAVIHFVSNNLKSSLTAETGFHFEYTVAATIYTGSNSDLDIWQKEGYITSHYTYPEKHSTNIDSSITLRGLVRHQRVSITFLSFDIYYSNSHRAGCPFDFLMIDGVSNGSRKFCDELKFKPRIGFAYHFLTTEDYLVLKFKTNENEYSTDKGLLLYYTVNPPPTTQNTTTLSSASKTTQTDQITTITQSEVGSVTTKAEKLSVGTMIMTTSANFPSKMTNILSSHQQADFTTGIVMLNPEKTSKQPVSGRQVDPVPIAVGAGSFTLVVFVVAVVLTICCIRKRNKQEKTNRRPMSRSAESIQMSTSNAAYFTGEVGFHTANYTVPSHHAGTDKPIHAEVEEHDAGVYHLAASTVEEYENFELIPSTATNKNSADIYADITSSTKTNKGTPYREAKELVENDLYGT